MDYSLPVYCNPIYRIVHWNCSTRSVYNFSQWRMLGNLAGAVVCVVRRATPVVGETWRTVQHRARRWHTSPSSLWRCHHVPTEHRRPYHRGTPSLCKLIPPAQSRFFVTWPIVGNSNSRYRRRDKNNVFLCSRGDVLSFLVIGVAGGCKSAWLVCCTYSIS